MKHLHRKSMNTAAAWSITKHRLTAAHTFDTIRTGKAMRRGK